MKEREEDCAIYAGWKGASERKSPTGKKKREEVRTVIQMDWQTKSGIKRIRHEKEER